MCAGLVLGLLFWLHYLVGGPIPAAGTFLIVTALFLFAAKSAAALCVGETLGLHLLRLEVITFECTRPSVRQRLLRVAGGLLSTITITGLLWSIADEEGLGWADHVSRTFISPAQ
jgi:hypothetical protein